MFNYNAIGGTGIARRTAFRNLADKVAIISPKLGAVVRLDSYVFGLAKITVGYQLLDGTLERDGSLPLVSSQPGVMYLVAATCICICENKSQ